MAAAHPFADRWNHNTHYYPLIAGGVPGTARTVLDLGCGDGTLAGHLAAEGRLVVAADLDRSVMPRPADGVVAAATSAEALGFRDGSFDAVVMSTVLHHADADRALREVTRVLVPGGALIILGLARFGGWRDVPHEVRDVVVHRALARRRRAWEPPTVKADPLQTWADVRATTRRLLPDSTYRRLPMWRYLVTWRKP